MMLLAWPVSADDEKAKGKDESATPAEQYKALDKEFNDAMQAFQKAHGEAKTEKERQQLFQDKYPQPDKFAPKFLALAEKHPKDPAAVNALVWIVTHIFGPTGQDNARSKALVILARDHITNEMLGEVCIPMLAYSGDKESEAMLRKALEHNPHKDVQGRACLTLAQQLIIRARTSKDPKDDKFAKEAEELFERVVAKYADVKMEYFGKIGDKAKAELFEIRHLATGKPAPEIEGEDQDGKKFKLSDYKGKVVLLDFWSQF
jgi:hypothetical protein